MRRLKSRPRVDLLVNQKRAGGAAWGKRAYLALLALFGVALVDYAAGDAVILRADGIVLTDRAMVAAAYPARVVAVHAREGQVITRGEPLAVLESTDILKDIADLAARNADLVMREGQLRVRQASLSSLLPLAERHAQESAGQLARIDQISSAGLVAATRMDQALSSRFESAAKLADLRAQTATLEGELAQLATARSRATEALAQLETVYARGLVTSPTSGVVGARIPVVGQAVRFGDELMQVNGGQAYVLAYLPDIHLFMPKPGDAVELSVGALRTTARVEAILSIADALPAEFQNMFRPRDRSRLVRLSLPQDHGFAISQKVRVRGCAFGYCWS